jgi:hypothetical protein
MPPGAKAGLRRWAHQRLFYLPDERAAGFGATKLPAYGIEQPALDPIALRKMILVLTDFVAFEDMRHDWRKPLLVYVTYEEAGAPGATRTHDTRFRKRLRGCRSNMT